MKLLLVDDDKIVIETMQGSFPWMDCGITEVKTAWSVRQAEEILCNERIDILLCDIEMPLATGIELIEWTKEKLNYPVVTILLTCHSEFQYAQRAIQLGCSNYLLKPVEESELKKTILDAEERVIEYQKQEKERWRREQKIHNIDAVWETIFAHRIHSGEKLRRVCDEYEIDPMQEYQPVLITVKHHSFRSKDISRSLMSFIMENIIRESFQGRKIALVNHYNEKLWLFFEKISDIEKEHSKEFTEQALTKHMEEIENWLWETYGCAMSCYIGQICTLANWQEECGMLQAADERFAVSPRVYLPAEVRRTRQFPFDWPDIVKNQLYSLFLAEKYETLIDVMTEYFSELEPEQCSVASLRGAVWRLDQEFEKRLSGAKIERFQRRQVELFQENPDYIQSIPGILEYYKRLFEGVQPQEQRGQNEMLLEKVKLFISMNMQEDISREDVAAHVGLHPDYLNRIIKKELGVSLREYIAGEKINVACELLAQTELLVGEIGEMVGYVNFSSFSTFFKNKTGMTPVAWRKEHEKC